MNINAAATAARGPVKSQGVCTQDCQADHTVQPTPSAIADNRKTKYEKVPMDASPRVQGQPSRRAVATRSGSALTGGEHSVGPAGSLPFHLECQASCWTLREFRGL